jgi:hypothetical protein
MKSARQVWAILAAEAVLIALVGINVPYRRVAHSVPVPGLPGDTVDFVQDRSALDLLLGRSDGYVIRHSNGSECKHPVPADVSLDELRQGSSVEYDGHTLTVVAPRGIRVSTPGYTP